MISALVIFNPTAGLSTRQDIAGAIKKYLTATGYKYQWCVLDEQFEQNLARLNLSHIKLVMAVGGDGTARLATQTILDQKLDAALAIIPYGSANVTAAALGIPLSTIKALRLIQPQAPEIKIDVGVVNQKYYFLVGLSAGYISRIVTQTPRRWKNRWGLVSYVLRLFGQSFRLNQHDFIVTGPAGQFQQRGNSLVVFNALKLLGLSPRQPVSLTDGILNLYIITNRHFWQLVTVAWYLVWYKKPPRHLVTHDAASFTIQTVDAVGGWQIDGDPLVLTEPITVSVKSNCLRVLVPNSRSR